MYSFLHFNILLYVYSGNFDSWSEHDHMYVIAWIDRRPSTTNNNNHNMLWHSRPGAREESFMVDVPEGGGRFMLCFQSTNIVSKEQRDKVRLELIQARKQRRKEQLKEGADETTIEQYENELEEELEEDDSVYEIEPVTVGFSIRVDNVIAAVASSTLPDGEMGPDAQRAIELLQQASMIELNWKNLIDHFDFVRNRESYQNLLTDQINNRVIHWSIIEALLVVLMAVGQVLYWRKFFEQRRYL
jgi:emp24/gp25L/p24 family/GOLD